MIIVAILALLALAGSGWFIARSILQLPPPTGPFAVGTVSFPRGRFKVELWYPALPSGRRALYGTGAGGWKGWLYHRLVRTNSISQATPLPRRSPVVLYVPAWGGQRTENTALAEELASHGYVVAAFDDVTRDSPVASQLAGAFDVRSAQAYRASLELAQRRLTYEANRASKVLDFLTRLNAGDYAGRFTDRFDLQHVGIFGYSFGGAVALETCRRDRRFSAAMNFDGILFGAGDGYSGGIPYFLVSDSNPMPTIADLASADPEVRYLSKLIFADDPDQRGVLRHGGYELTIAGTRHGSFNDMPLVAPLQRVRSGWSNPPRITSALRQYTLAFFDRELLGTPTSLLTPGTWGRPAMTLTVGTVQ